MDSNDMVTLLFLLYVATVDGVAHLGEHRSKQGTVEQICNALSLRRVRTHDHDSHVCIFVHHNNKAITLSRL